MPRLPAVAPGGVSSSSFPEANDVPNCMTPRGPGALCYKRGYEADGITQTRYVALKRHGDAMHKNYTDFKVKYLSLENDAVVKKQRCASSQRESPTSTPSGLGLLE